MKTLSPLILKERYFKPVEREIALSFYHMVFRPILAALEPFGIKEIMNALGLTDAILKGKVTYIDGEFKGNFNALISRQFKALGGKYNARSRSWTLPTIPADVQLAIAQAQESSRAMIQATVKALDNIVLPENPALQFIRPSMQKAVEEMDSDFVKLSQHIAIPPTLTDRAAHRISEEWATNLDLYIKDWASSAILELREKVTDSAMKGIRAESLQKTIEAEYGVSRRKAKFLARQETSLLMSKFQEERYADIGIQKYIWSGADDERERPDHKRLNGQVFYFSNPPVTNLKTGAKNNPGEDYGCRCVAIPVID